MTFALLAGSDLAVWGRPPPTSPTVRDSGHGTVVTLRGEADGSTRPALSDALSEVIAWRVGDVVIDLSEVAFIDTATVRALAVAEDLLQRRDRKLTFRSPSRLAARVIQLFGLDDLIEGSDTAAPVGK